MNSELTWDKAVDSVITTPQSEWSPYQIAVANLNPDLKSKNKRYQNALNTKSILENERVNLWQAWELMMNAYRNAIDQTEQAAQWMMAANWANAAIQSWAMISWSWGLSTNPAVAAATRLAAQNQANVQNMQIRSNADQNIANVYSNMAQVPATLSSIASNNAQMDDNAITTMANANLANAQAEYYRKQWTSTWWWTSSKKSSSWWSSEWSEESDAIDPNDYIMSWEPWNPDNPFVMKTKDWQKVTNENILAQWIEYYKQIQKLKEQTNSNNSNPWWWGWWAR